VHLVGYQHTDNVRSIVKTFRQIIECSWYMKLHVIFKTLSDM
jgi:hypothetical protein